MIRHDSGQGVMAALALVTACTPATPRPEPGNLPAAAGGPAASDPVRAINILSIDRRAVFMSGHVAAGLALYRAGQPQEAAAHLMHPVSEMHADEREGFAAIGFDAAIFEAVSAALDEGRPAAEVEPLLRQAEDNLKAVRAASGGEARDLIEFLMKTCAFEYDAGVNAVEIVNAGEYQDAYGFAVVARDIARGLDPEAAGDLVLELELLVRMWPSEGPVSTLTPAPEPAIAAQIARVNLALSLLP